MIAHRLRRQRLVFHQKTARIDEAHIAHRQAQQFGDLRLKLAPRRRQQRGHRMVTGTAPQAIVARGAHSNRGDAVLGERRIGLPLGDRMVLEFGERHAAAIGRNREAGRERDGEDLCARACCA